MMSGLARSKLKETVPEPPASWDPLARDGKGYDGRTSHAPPRTSIPEIAGNVQKYFKYIWIILMVWMFLPFFVIGVFSSGISGIGFMQAPFAVAALGVVFFFIIFSRRNKTAKSVLDRLRSPAIREPVAEAASRIGLSPAGTITPERLERLRGPLGDIYAALELPSANSPAVTTEAPDEFHGRLPDGSPVWLLVRKSEVPLAGVPEQFRGGRAPDLDIPAQALRMLASFPLSRRTGFRLEILHRVMQVMFLRAAFTIDTGSTGFNNRFLAAAGKNADALAVHRSVTPALQSVLIELFDRYWLVNVTVDDDTVFVSAVDFRHRDGGEGNSARWIEATLRDFLASVARIRNYID